MEERDERDERAAQVARARRLQDLWLKRMETLLESGAATSTDLATLARVLMANGWSLDPSALPSSLRDKLTSKDVSFDDEDEDGEPGAPKLKAI